MTETIIESAAPASEIEPELSIWARLADFFGGHAPGSIALHQVPVEVFDSHAVRDLHMNVGDSGDRWLSAYVEFGDTSVTLYSERFAPVSAKDVSEVPA